MTSLVLSRSEPLSIITLTAPGATPAWRQLFDWPAAGHQHVDFADDSPARRNASATRLDAAVTAADHRVLLVAEGAACFAAAWWARLSPSDYVRRVAGALMVRPLAAADAADRYASPGIALPFDALIVDDDADPAAQRLALDWGGASLPARALPAFGATPRDAARPWSQAGRLFARYTASVVRRDLRLARARLR